MRRLPFAVVIAIAGGAGCTFIDDFGSFSFGDAGSTEADGGPVVEEPMDGGDERPDVAGDRVPPTVLSATPSGMLVDARTRILVRFDERILAGESDATLALAGTGPIPGRAVADGTTLELTPDRLLDTAGRYTVTVSSAVTDLAGNALAEPYSFEFELVASGDGGAGARRLDSGSSDVTCPQIVGSSEGDAAILFSEGDAIHLVRYRAGEGFSAPQMVATGTMGAIAMSPNGTLAVGYTTMLAGEPRFVVRVAAPAMPLGDVELADEGASNAIDTSITCVADQHDKALAVNDAGAVVTVWFTAGVSGGAATYGSNVNFRAPDGAWGTPLDGSRTGSADMAPRAAIDAGGEAMVLYSTGTGFRTRQYSSVTGDWGALVTPSGTGSPSAGPQLGVDDAGYFTLAVASVVSGDSEVFASVESAAGSARDELRLDVSGSPSTLHLDARLGSYLVWANGSGIGVARLAGGETTWSSRSGVFDGSFPDDLVVGGFGVQREGLVAYDSGSEIEVHALTLDPTTSSPAAGVGGTLAFSRSGTISAPRLFTDLESRHGILAFIRDNGGGDELYAYSFRNLPPLEQP